MSIKCGWASQSENKTVNGKKGDQTKLEVKIGEYYNFGQNKVIRFKSVAKAKLGAKAMESICKNDNIGYGQKDRETLYNKCKKMKWDINKISKIGLCNTDCSETCAVCINLAYGKELIPSGVYTGNLASVCEKTGLFNILKDEKYYKNDNYLKIGDMPIKEGHHVIMALQNGSKISEKAKSSSPYVKVDTFLYKSKTIIKGYYSKLLKSTKYSLVYDCKNGWSKIKVNNQIGYCKNETLSDNKLSNYGKCIMTKSGNIKEKNKKLSKTLGKIQGGDKQYTVISVGKYWTNIKYDNKEVFVSTKKIKLV